MSQFTESKTKVRCVDCSFRIKGTCSERKIKIAPKKKRTCSVYSFKGVYENRKSLPSTYVPNLDKKTIKMLRRMFEQGIAPVPGVDSPAAQRIMIPRTTATASPQELENTPGMEEQNESDSSRG